MIEFGYHRVKEDMASKGMKMQENQIKRKEKLEQKQYEKKIELDSRMEKKEGRSDAQILTRKGHSIGEYIGPGLIGLVIDNFRRNRFDLDQIFRLLDKITQVKALNLCKGMSNTCPCVDVVK